MPPDRPSFLTLRVLLWRARHVLVVLAFAGLALTVARTLAPPSPPTASVVVTARAVPAGHTLADADLRTVAWPHHLAPDDGLDDVAVGALLGRKVLVDLPAGTPLVSGLLAGDRYDVALPPGAVVVPVRLADPAVTALLRPGDRVDLVRAVESGHEIVARRALVVQAEQPSDRGGPLGLGADPAPALTVVAVAPDEGRALAAAGAWDALGAVIVDG